VKSHRHKTPAARKKTHRRTPAKTAKRTRPRVVVRAKQWRMPAGFLRGTDKPATLRQVVSPDTPTVDGENLTDEQRAKLTMLRIAKQRKYRMMSIRHGVIDKKRAIEEIRQQTALGRALVEIEQIAIGLIRQEVARRRTRARTARRRAAR
jgi:hypothetical protein